MAILILILILLRVLHEGGGSQVGEVTRLGGVNPPLHAIVQTHHPGVHFLKIIGWSLRQEKCWQTTCFGD